MGFTANVIYLFRAGPSELPPLEQNVQMGQAGRAQAGAQTNLFQKNPDKHMNSPAQWDLDLSQGFILPTLVWKMAPKYFLAAAESTKHLLNASYSSVNDCEIVPIYNKTMHHKKPKTNKKTPNNKNPKKPNQKNKQKKIPPKKPKENLPPSFIQLELLKNNIFHSLLHEYTL